MTAGTAQFYDTLAASLRGDWSQIARPNQLSPPGDWLIWLLLAGRGFGKTRTGAEWVRAVAEGGKVERIALVAPTASDCRDVMVLGESGILACAPTWMKPEYQPTKRRVLWPNGAFATLYSGDEPERLRGPQHGAAWCDELASFRYPEAWDMLMLGLRLGRRPRCVVTATPKPVRLIRELLKREGGDVVVSRGSTFDNAANLAPTFLRTIRARYEGTRLGRQELYAQVLEDAEGALWSHEMLEAARVDADPPREHQRVVVAIDPAGSSAEGSDETGIVVAGLGHDGHGYVLADLSGRYAPADWARRALGAYYVWKADRLVCETNYGGEMVANTVAAVDPSAPVKLISSSRGKVLRAEPIAAFFEQRRAHLVGSFPELEDQMCNFTADWSRGRDGSPDRVDAAVFALTELMLGLPAGGYFPEHLLLKNGEPVPVPFRPRHVFAVGMASKAQDVIGVLYLAATPQADIATPITVLDWDVLPVDPELFAAPWLASVFERLAALDAECDSLSKSPSFWIHEEGVGTALLRLGLEAGHAMWNIDEHLELAPDLATLISDCSSWIHGGKVKATAEAYGKLVTLAGVTRNHLLAHLAAYKVGAEEPPESVLLQALCAGVILACPAEVRRKRLRRTA